SQIDLPHKQRSGLLDAMDKLKHLQTIGFIHLTTQDVVRHPLVSQIISAYQPQEVQEKNSSDA
ncbi:PhoH family protein, partial [Streptococcus danieliae]|nr:PhoH family protein [Streptococcus danieliae]